MNELTAATCTFLPLMAYAATNYAIYSFRHRKSERPSFATLVAARMSAGGER